ncbi:hypothetical protein Tco_1382524 [Tanacetum coccineum]
MKGQDNPLIPNPHPHLLNSIIKKSIIIPSSYQPKKTHKPRKAIRTTEISQSSGPINLVANETVHKELSDRMERAATTASSLEAEQDSYAQTRFETTSKYPYDLTLSQRIQFLNGNKVQKRTVREIKKEYEPTTIEEKQDRRNEMKARDTLLMALPNKDQLKFHSYKSWLSSTHALIWRNKEEIETISLDDLYNNLKIYEPELAGSSSISQNPQNVAFVSSNSTNSNCNSSINEADNTAYGVSATHT